MHRTYTDCSPDLFASGQLVELAMKIELVPTATAQDGALYRMNLGILGLTLIDREFMQVSRVLHLDLSRVN